MKTTTRALCAAAALILILATIAATLPSTFLGSFKGNADGLTNSSGVSFANAIDISGSNAYNGSFTGDGSGLTNLAGISGSFNGTNVNLYGATNNGTWNITGGVSGTHVFSWEPGTAGFITGYFDEGPTEFYLKAGKFIALYSPGFYGDGSGLTNLPTAGGATNGIQMLNGVGTNTTLYDGDGDLIFSAGMIGYPGGASSYAVAWDNVTGINFKDPLGSSQLIISSSGLHAAGGHAVLDDGSALAAPNLTPGGTLPALNGVNLTNVNATNVTLNPGVLTATSNQTNYVVPLLPGPSGNMLTIYTANTNCFFTFTGTNNANWQRTVLVRALTNTVPITLAMVHGQVITNSGFNPWVTNGLAEVVNFSTPDATGTNMLVSPTSPYGRY